MAASTISGRLQIKAIEAVGLEDCRFFGTMCPSVLIAFAKYRQMTPPVKGGGIKPKFDHDLPPIELENASTTDTVTFDVIDEKTIVGRAQMQLGQLLMAIVQSRSSADRLLHVELQSGKDPKKKKGEVTFSCLWLPKQQPQPNPPQQQQQQPQMVQPQQQQQMMQPQPMPQQLPMKTAPMMPMQMGYAAGAPPSQPQPQPMYAPPQQTGYAPPPQAYHPQPMPYAQQAPPPMQPMPMGYAQPTPMGYAPSPPGHYALAAASPQPYYAPQPQPMQPPMQPQGYYPPPMSAPIMPVAPQPAGAWIPVANEADGVFPYSQLTITRLIGDGTFGTVSAGEFRSTPVAIKQLKQTQFTQQQWQEFMSEVKFLREARHPNIVLFMGVTFNPYCIVTELLDMSLFDVLYKHKMALSMKQKLHIALGVARGLASLHGHSVPIVHRDIKSLNILVSKDLVSVKICDLGLVKYKAAAGHKLESNGTPLWMSPECLLDAPYDEQTDVYSYGCVLYELTTGQIPFGGGNVSKEELAHRVGRNGERPILPPSLEKPFRDLLIQCWQQHPQARPNMKQVVAALTAIPMPQ